MNRQDLQLPTAFLLDAEGRVVKVYRDRVDVPQILQDAPQIEASPAERLARALPFEGTFYSAPGRRDYVPYGRELLDQGLRGAGPRRLRAGGAGEARAPRSSTAWAPSS